MTMGGKRTMEIFGEGHGMFEFGKRPLPNRPPFRQEENLRDRVPEGVNPIAFAIEEEATILFKKLSGRSMASLEELEIVFSEFKDALMHNVSKTVDLLLKERHDHAYNHGKNEYERKLRDANNLLNKTQRELEIVRERNGRLHEDIKTREKREKNLNHRMTDLSKKVQAYEQRLFNPLIVPTDAKIDFNTNALLKHLEEEIAFLRTLVSKFTEE